MKRGWLAVLPAALAAAAVSGVAHAQVDVRGAWVRGTVPAQSSTGAFMTLQAHSAAKLVGASSPAAGTVELHEMKMDGNVMRMHAVPSIDLPAMQPVELKPSGYHVMLIGLKAPLAKGTTVPITLKIQQGGKMMEQKVNAEVRDISATGDGGGMDMSGHKP